MSSKKSEIYIKKALGVLGPSEISFPSGKTFLSGDFSIRTIFMTSKFYYSISKVDKYKYFPSLPI